MGDIIEPPKKKRSRSPCYATITVESVDKHKDEIIQSMRIEFDRIDQKMYEQTQQIVNLKAEKKKMEKQVSEFRKQSMAQEEMIACLDHELDKKDMLLAEKDRLLAEKDKLLADTKKFLADKNRLVESKNKLLAEKDRLLMELLDKKAMQVSQDPDTPPMHPNHQATAMVPMFPLHTVPPPPPRPPMLQATVMVPMFQPNNAVPRPPPHVIYDTDMPHMFNPMHAAAGMMPHMFNPSSSLAPRDPRKRSMSNPTQQPYY